LSSANVTFQAEAKVDVRRSKVPVVETLILIDGRKKLSNAGLKRRRFGRNRWKFLAEMAQEKEED